MLLPANDDSSPNIAERRLLHAPQDGGTGLPVQVVPHDALRQGLSSLKQTAEVSHPVEAIQDNVSTYCCTHHWWHPPHR